MHVFLKSKIPPKKASHWQRTRCRGCSSANAISRLRWLLFRLPFLGSTHSVGCLQNRTSEKHALKACLGIVGREPTPSPKLLRWKLEMGATEFNFPPEGFCSSAWISERYRQELSNENLRAEIGFDTTGNEPRDVSIKSTSALMRWKLGLKTKSCVRTSKSTSEASNFHELHRTPLQKTCDQRSPRIANKKERTKKLIAQSHNYVSRFMHLCQNMSKHIDTYWKV